MVRVYTEDGRAVLENIMEATTFWSRLRGLMGRRALAPHDGLLIGKCNAIHSCFMKMPIDAVFLSAAGEILHMDRNMVPWRFSRMVKAAKYVLECSPGTIDEHGFEIGDSLQIQFTDTGAGASEGKSRNGQARRSPVAEPRTWHERHS